MSPIRVLIVDDSSTYRRILADAVVHTPGLSVAGTVGTLAGARQRIGAGGVDAVALDVNLAGESGLDLLRWLHAGRLTLPVVLVTGDAAAVRSEVDAVFLGAAALVRKPEGAGAMERLRAELGRAFTPRTARALPQAPRAVAPRRREIIAVGASTGGPPVVLQFLRELPIDLDIPVLITQHMPATHLGFFARMLSEQSGHVVKLATAGELVTPGCVLVAPGTGHLTLARSAAGLAVAIDDGPEEHFCKPAVDPMFRSLAALCGAAVVAVVMTGMGCDGAQGALALHRAGAAVVAQDAATSIVWGMPGATVALDAADHVVPAAQLAQVVLGWTLPGRAAPIRKRASDGDQS